MQINKQKQLLREEFLTRRKKLDPLDVNKRSEKIVMLLLGQINWAEIKKMHCFLPIVESNEPDVRDLIYYAYEHGVQVFTSMPKVPVGELENIDISVFSLKEDIEFDLVIVPMLAYDPIAKHRLGFGGGFYDRLLASQTNALTIGVCFKEFEIKNLPVESTDIALDQIVTV